MKFLERLFDGTKPELNQDPRWQRFNDASYKCPCCGRNFSGIFDIGFDHPDPWPHGNLAKSGESVIKVGKDRLDQDLCRFGEHYFVRSVLYLPITGPEEKFGFGCWGSLSKENFEKYLDDACGKATFEGAFSWLCNSLPCFESPSALACDMVPGDEGQRPSLWAKEGHALHAAQREGISFDDLLDIYAKSGNDIRPHLTDA